MHISKTPYYGLGIILAPKTKQTNGHLIINVLMWEINFVWGKF
jgi:hypothetical protein